MIFTGSPSLKKDQKEEQLFGKIRIIQKNLINLSSSNQKTLGSDVPCSSTSKDDDDYDDDDDEEDEEEEEMTSSDEDSCSLSEDSNVPAKSSKMSRQNRSINRARILWQIKLINSLVVA